MRQGQGSIRKPGLIEEPGLLSLEGKNQEGAAISSESKRAPQPADLPMGGGSDQPEGTSTSFFEGAELQDWCRAPRSER